MVTKISMVMFYLACGYEERTAEVRADEYMTLQKTFNDSLTSLAEMTEQDQYQIQLTEKENE